MMYPEMKEVLRGLLSVLLFGAIMGILRPLLERLIDFLLGLVNIPLAVVSNVKSGGGIKALSRGAFKNTRGARWGAFWTDLIFVLSFGIGFILLLYVVCDGSFRLYVLLLSILSALASYVTVGRYAGILLGSILGYLSVSMAFLLYIPTKFINVAFCHKINTHKRLDKVQK